MSRTRSSHPRSSDDTSPNREVSAFWAFVSAPRVWAGALLGLILLVAFALRFYHLGDKSLWGDEIFEVKRALRSLGALWSQRQGDDFLLHFVLVKLATLLGRNEFWYRLPSALLSVLIVPVTFVLGRRIGGLAVGLVVMLLIAVAPYQIWYAQEARMYSAQCLFAVLSLYCFLRVWQTPSLSAVVGLTLANTLGLYNHLFAIFPLVVECIAAFLFVLIALRTRPLNRRPLLFFVASLVLTFVLVLPLAPATLGFVVTESQDAVVVAGTTADKMNASFFKDWLIFYGMGMEWGWRTFLSLLLACTGALWLIMKRPRYALVCLLWLGVPFLALYLANPEYNLAHRYLIFMQPVYLILMAVGVIAPGRVAVTALQARGARRPAPVAGAVIGGLVVLYLVVAAPLNATYARAKFNDWRAIVNYLQAQAQPGDLIIAEGKTWASGAVEFYLKNDLRYSRPRADLAALNQAVQDGRRLWFVSLGGIYDHPVERWAQQNLTAVEPAAWQRPELAYAPRDEFLMPQFESPVRLYRNDGALPSHIIYQDRSAGSAGKSHIQVKPRATLEAKLQPSPAAPRALQLEWSAGQGARFDILANNQLVTHVDDTNDKGWTTRTWNLPSGGPAPVLVRITNRGSAPLLIHALAVGAPPPAP